MTSAMRRIDAATFCTTASSEPRAALTTRVDKMSIKSISYILSGVLLGLLLLVSVPARAGLFDDEGARRQIIELQRQIDANAKGLQGLQPRLERVEASITERVLDLSQLIDGMRQDMARLRCCLGRWSSSSVGKKIYMSISIPACARWKSSKTS